MAVLRALAVWGSLSLPFALLIGRAFYARNRRVAAGIHLYRGGRTQRPVLRAAVVVGLVGAAGVVATATDAARRLPDASVLTRWATEMAQVSTTTTTAAAGAVDVVPSQLSEPGAQEETGGWSALSPYVPPTVTPTEPDATSSTTTTGSAAEAAPSGPEDAVDTLGRSRTGGDDEEGEEGSAGTTTTTAPGATTTTTTGTEPPPEQGTTTTTTTPAATDEDPTTDTGTTTTTTAPEPTEPVEAPN